MKTPDALERQTEREGQAERERVENDSGTLMMYRHLAK